MKHDLKTWRDSFAAIIEERKRYEVRKELDRAFREGDILFLREWDEEQRRYTGRAIEALVTHITRGPEWDIPDGIVVMSIELVDGLIENVWPPEQDDPEVTRDLLSLASAEVSIDRICGWSTEERKAADDWASACLLAMSANESPPPMPQHVQRDRR